MTSYPLWLHILSCACLSLSFASAVFIILDEIRRPQQMIIMSFVWPVTALYFGPVALCGYLKSGLKMTKLQMQQMESEVRAELDAERKPDGATICAPRRLYERKPSVEQTAVGVSHCGAGCTLGDIGAEWWVCVTGLQFAGGVFQTRILLDFLLAWAFGVFFQYFTIAPMRGLSFGKGIVQAIRVDTLSIVAFQIGMSAWMALTYFILFPRPPLRPDEAVFWFMMQIAMIVGFVASYPANRFLLSTGWKEKMPQYRDELKRRMLEQHCRSRAA
ncbi:MAG TPA: DUF4396 domain-containing protein [Candidatus Acidoferrum sp.]|nr:DUF4396 domain-containing protein [Candidatus Acidoferrum sp.]